MERGGKEGHAAGFLIIVNTFDSVVRKDDTAILYCDMICLYIYI